jgi:hypothetical protein
MGVLVGLWRVFWNPLKCDFARREEVGEGKM